MALSALSNATLKHGSRASTHPIPHDERVCDKRDKQRARLRILADEILDLDDLTRAEDPPQDDESEPTMCYDTSCDYVSPRALLGLPELQTRGRRMAFYEAGDDEDAFFAELGMHIVGSR